MKTVPVEEAVGLVLSHDITEIVPGSFKGAAFKRGHVIQQDDIGKLRDLGKENIAVLELSTGWVHEDDAAKRLATASAGNGITLSTPSEGKVDLIAKIDGLLKVNVSSLEGINSIDNLMMATLHGNRLVMAGQIVAGTRIIPLTIQNEVLCQAEALCQPDEPIVTIRPLKQIPVGIVTTGNEVYHNRIEDKFGPVVRDKINSLGSHILGQTYVPDDVDAAVTAIKKFIADGAEMVTITGGMSVDPDDLTPSSIRATGAKVITYGAPVLPGAMFMLAYLGNIPILGLPGCVMYHKASIFDLILPRILAGERLTRKDFVQLGHGGMCTRCDSCRFPDCGFGV